MFAAMTRRHALTAAAAGRRAPEARGAASAAAGQLVRRAAPSSCAAVRPMAMWTALRATTAPHARVLSAVEAPQCLARRALSSAAGGGMEDDVLRKRLNEFQDLFTEARLCIEDAVESQESTYFDEEAETATASSLPRLRAQSDNCLYRWPPWRCGARTTTTSVQ